jgi:hypothetical protein
MSMKPIIFCGGIARACCSRAALLVLAAVACFALGNSASRGTPSGSDPILAEIQRELLPTEKPSTLKFRRDFERLKAPAFKHSQIGQVLLMPGELKAVLLLDEDRSFGLHTASPRRQGFVEKPDYLMQYDYYGEERQERSGPEQVRMANSGEAVIGLPGCGCTEKVLPFPILPELLAETLGRMTGVEVIHGGAGAPEGLLEILGQPEGEPEGSQWRIKFRRINGYWAPVETDVFIHGNRAASIRATFDEASSAYSIEEIKTTLFQKEELLAVLTYSRIELHPGDHTDESLLLADQIPERVIVNELRFERPFAYIMGARPPTAQELEKMAGGEEGVLEYQRNSRHKTLSNKRMFPSIAAVACILLLTFVMTFLWLKKKSGPSHPERI